MNDVEIRGNEAAIREVLTYIELHSELWDQDSFVGQNDCGTTYCLAGWTYILKTGKRFGVVVQAPGLLPIATDALGLTPEQAHALFYFTSSSVDENWPFTQRRVTFAELCDKVYEVTGVRHIKQGSEAAFEAE